MTPISGFTFIRNAIKYDFPIRECIASMLPLVDELVVNVGNSEDGTEALMKDLAAKNPKIKLVHSIWNDQKTEKGLVLSEQTNIALDACTHRWALYLQADEAIHEAEYDAIRKAVEAEEAKTEPAEGLRFRYYHFYGGMTLVQRPWNWYSNEIRIVRRDSGIRSFGDAQTFRIGDVVPRTELIDAHIFHYGHAREPERMKEKIKYFHRFWHGDGHGIQVAGAYNLNWKDLVWFWSTHPVAYTDRVRAAASHSPRPSDAFGARPKFERIVIHTNPSKMSLMGEIRELLLAHGFDKNSIHVAHGVNGWGREILKSLPRRSKSVLIDLCAESSNPIIFAGRSIDAFSAYSFRIAHAPEGRMPAWRARIFTRISWGRSEKEGFEVPDTQYARQIVRWLGVNA